MTERANKILVRVTLQAGLRKYLEGRDETVMELPEGATLQDLVERLGMAEEDVWVVGVNGVLAKRSNRLDDGDRIEFFEPVAGG